MDFQEHIKEREKEFDELRRDCTYSAPEIIEDRYKSFLSSERTALIKFLLEKVEEKRKDLGAKKIDEFQSKINWANPRYNEALDEIKSLLKSYL